MYAAATAFRVRVARSLGWWNGGRVQCWSVRASTIGTSEQDHPGAAGAEEGSRDVQRRARVPRSSVLLGKESSVRRLFLVLALAVGGTVAAAAPASAGCFTPTVAGFNTVQVCVLDVD